MTLTLTTVHLTIYLACWLFTSFEPIQEGIDLVFELLPKNTLVNSFWTLLGCQYCFTLWLTWGITNDFLIALVLSAIAQIHAKIIK